MIYSVLGAGGFIGQHLVAHLQALGHEVFAPQRNDPEIFRRPLGHVIYCIGLTADFRQRPFDTVRAHVSVLAEVLERAEFDSLLYLSSTRVYAKSADTQETASLVVAPGDSSDLYNISKLMGESLCLNCGRSAVRVARLSNVVGHDPASENFLSALIREARSGSILLRTALNSAKDFILLDDVVNILPRISSEGRATIYNVASGCNIDNHELVARLTELVGCRWSVLVDAPLQSFPMINIDRLRDEFVFRPRDPLEALPSLISSFRNMNAEAGLGQHGQGNLTK